MSTITKSSAEANKEPVYFNPRATIDLGIKEFKKMARSRYYSKTLVNRLVRDFKKRQWAMYHEMFPVDNSSVPTHTHLALDKLELI